MSDGREEREEIKERIEQQRRGNADEQGDANPPDEWEPERPDS